MALVVHKYGGSSVGTIERIRAVARRCAAVRAAGDDLAVVVSAMKGETDRLLGLAAALSALPDRREQDVLVATGEQVSVALLAIALKELGCEARSFLGHQVRILTDSSFNNARIRDVDAAELRGALGRGQVAVVAGFQGIDAAGNITTLGRGGSDTTAVAIAAALGAARCDIYTDVDGVYTADPNVCAAARKLDHVSYEEMLELASLGAKVLQIRSVAIASKYRLPVHTRSSFNDNPGTWLVESYPMMEDVVVLAVAHDLNQAQIQLADVPDRPGIAAVVFGALAADDINVDMIIQGVGADGRNDVSFTVRKEDLERARRIIERVAGELGAAAPVVRADVCKVSVVGQGMRHHAGVAARMFSTLAEQGINILSISTSEIKVSCVIDARYAELAVRSLHDVFIGA
ncbi:MAG TPA: aspartate kinase [Myxococcota bacterium]|nr:aspartate kinase [Myxococcota bacterium]